MGFSCLQPTATDRDRRGHVNGPVRFRLRAGGVEHQHVDWAKTIGHRSDEPNDLQLVGDVRRESRSNPAGALDFIDDREHPRVIAQAVNGDREAIAGEPLSDRAAETSRAAGHKSNPLLH